MRKFLILLFGFIVMFFVTSASGEDRCLRGNTYCYDTVTDTLELKKATNITGVFSSTDIPPIGTDPDITVAGYLGRDSDEHSLRGSDGTVQFIYGQKFQTIQISLESPDLFTARDLFPVWSNESGFTFVVTEIKSWSDDDNVDYVLEEYAPTNLSSATTIHSVVITDGGTNVFWDTVSSPTAPNIENGNIIAIDFSDTDTPDFVKITIKGYYNGDVD